jgi:hypothetical protein
LEKLGKNAGNGRILWLFLVFIIFGNLFFKNFGFMEFTGSIFWIDAERTTKP